ncbi:MAG: primase [Actinomycetia bacterium]|nr:primase [Actinomycetes bacterium]
MSKNDEPPAQPGAGEPAEERLSPGVPEGLPQLSDLPTGALTEEEDAHRALVLEAALGYARRGMHVVPVRWVDADGTCVCARGAECDTPGKHPVHEAWPEVASTDPAQIGGWWRPEPEPGRIVREWFPYANLGIVTGRLSGVFVLDVDTYAGGQQTLSGYERRNGELPPTRVHGTGRDGTHYFFLHPDFDIRNSAGRVLGKGLDVKGEAGLVVAPPSVSGYGAYTLNPAHDIDPVPAPGWLLDLLRGYDKSQNGSALSGQAPSEATGAARRYAEAALKAEAARMRDAPDGTRNETLNQCAFSLGTLGGAGLLSEDTAFAALREAAVAAGLGETEIRQTFRSGWRAGLQDPREIQWQSMRAEWPARPRTEFGLADRMADWFGDSLRWCADLATWMRYQNGVWHTDVKDAGEWHAQMMLRMLESTEALSYDDDPEFDRKDGVTEVPSARARFLEWLSKQQTRKAVSSAARLATGVPLMRMSQSSFDADPGVLNVRNGVIELATGRLRPHDPEYRMTLQAAASYDPGARCPQWEEFLERVQPDPAIRAYLQRVAGYCATGLTTEQVFFLLTGSGANGKSVFQNVLLHILGSYGQTVPVDTLMASSVDGRIPNDVARMSGKRMMAASETKAGKSLDEARMKQLTGGDTVAARHMRAEWFEFEVVGKIWLTSNHLPRLSDDAATWRRIHLITWDVVIPEEERDGFLQQRLIAEESAGILRWLADGARAWYADGLQPPQAVFDARAAYQKDEDVVGQFVNECCDVVDPVKGALGRDVRSIYHAYKAWATDQGLPVIGQKLLTTRLKRKFPDYTRSNSWAGFPTLQVRQFTGPMADDEGDEDSPSA